MHPTWRKAAGIILSVFLGAAFAFTQVAMATGGEHIESFASDITVRVDGTVGITEKIEYVFPQGEERHGIFRDIPTRYVADDGNRYEIPLDVTSVTDGAGSPWPYQLTGQPTGTRIKIGDPDKTVTGSRTYVITYEARGALRYFDDHDELYWNVTGTEWPVPIGRTSATVRLPAEADPKRMTFTCYTGPRGSTAKDCLANAQGRVASFVADKGPLTVVVGWQHGAVAKLEAIPYNGSSMATWSLPPIIPNEPISLGILFATLIGLYVYWQARGRDAVRGRALVVQYDPPEGLRPAEVGTIMDQRADMADISAAIVDLAVRGYVTIDEVKGSGLFGGKEYSLALLKTDYGQDKSLKQYEILLLGEIFQSGTYRALSEFSDGSFAKPVAAIKKEIYTELTAEGYFYANPESVRNRFLGIGVFAAFGGFALAFSFLGSGNDARIPASIAISGLLVAFAGFAMPRRTEKGALAFEHARGFKEYLSRAEKYRLEWQEKENMFEAFLPYAMTFGVVAKWTKALAAMGIEPRQPGWYSGPTGGAFNVAAFGSSLNAFGSAMGSAAAPASSGSGFSGGSSGGGGGGGGGGSW